MFEKPLSYDSFYLPGDMDFDQALRLGFAWLLEQPGTPLVVLSAKKMVNNNNILADLVRRHRVEVVAPPRVFQSSWRGGPVLAPLVNERALLAVDDDLGDRVTAMCVIEWLPGDHATWIAGHGARDLRTPDAAPETTEMLHPVVVAAMTEAGHSINHNNALVTDSEKAMVVLTLQVLVKGGYTFDVDELAAWATRNGWFAKEMPKLREYANRVLEGRKFQLRDPWGPKAVDLKRWEAQADGAAART